MALRATALGMLMLWVALGSGCPMVPEKELTAAELALSQARDQRAEECASETYRAAEKMLEQAREYVKKKDWDQARKAAQAAEKLARQAEAESKADYVDCLGRLQRERGEQPPAISERPTIRRAEGDAAATEPPGNEPELIGFDRPLDGMRTIYFAFDDDSLDEDARRTLQQNVDWLEANPKVVLRLAGHTDSRGATEYNLALGERRGQSVRRYLVTLGVDPGRLRVVSFGEEKPAVDREDEQAWARNRRVEFVPVR